MANATSSPTAGRADPPPPPPSPPTVLVVLRCTLPPPLIQHLFDIGAADYLPAGGSAQQWLAAGAAATAAPPPAAADPDPAHLAARLSPCELDVVRLIGQGCSNRAIAKHRCRSISTIESQKSRIRKKLGFANQMELAQWACRLIDAETLRRAA
jgi:DNA-binding NarL/FixJ family response regulator